MVGYLKWVNIKYKKVVVDVKCGKIWICLIKEIQVVVCFGGGDVNLNLCLCFVVDKVVDVNMLKDNVKCVIDCGVGGVDGVNYEEIWYEGYGISGVVIIVDMLIDNCICMVVEVCYVFLKFGGNMGIDGLVVFMFDYVGQFLFVFGMLEDVLMEVVFEVGVNDVNMNDDGLIEVLCDWQVFLVVKDVFEVVGFKVEFVEVMMKLQNEVEFIGDDVVKMQKFLDVFENFDDVQDVYMNVVIVEE